MQVSAFDYELPPELIAREPLPERSASRMLLIRRDREGWEDWRFRDLPELLHRDDLLVLNNTRVFPARLFGRRLGLRAVPLSPRNPASRNYLHGRVEVLLLRQVSTEPNEWEGLVRPGRKVASGERIVFGEHELEAQVVARGEFGERRLRFAPAEDFFGALDRLGHVPLPPYLGRDDRPADRERYQTVYAREPGSAAAPTAGLHFTQEILEQLRDLGIETAEITLHVGLGTFQPVHGERVEEHTMHREWYCISPEAANQLNRARASGRRIVAVGTTTVRTLEHAIARNPESLFAAGSSEADLFIYPGFRFRSVGALLTNFHLPRSTLLMLVSAFAGREPVLAAYAHAVRERYRFYSYGDCMLIE